MIAIPAGGGGGYSVDAQSLHGFAQVADNAGQSVETLASQAQTALESGVAGGLDMGAAIARAEGQWATRLKQLSAQATGIASNLTANAASYEQADSAVLDGFTSVLRGAGLAL